MIQLRSPELLSPAGSLESMRYAFSYGADAVYAGQPRYSLRTRNNAFSKLETIQEGIEEAHKKGKKFFLANNIAPHNAKIKTYLQDIAPVIALKPDALIMSDPGMIMMIRENFPDQEIHLSVQMNTVNYRSIKFWQQVGIKRIILSRELSLEEIEEIRQQCPDIGLEVFVHGALCMAYSGRCLLSGYIKHRDPNQGTCINACRNKYKVTEAKQDEWGNVVSADTTVLIANEQQPNDYLPMFEDEHGTYIMNSKDLRAIHHVEKLIKMGIDSLKIEGRTKSFFYAARTTQLYRQAIDDAVNGQSFNPSLMDKLEGLAHRGYTEGFLRRHVFDEYQQYEHNESTSATQQFVGEIESVNHHTGLVKINVRNHFEVGDSIELMLPSGNQHIILDNMQNEHGQSISTAKGSGHKVFVQFKEIPLEQMNDGLLIRNLP